MLVCPLCRVALDPTETTCPRDGQEGEEQQFDDVKGDLAERFEIVQPYARGATGTLYLADERQTGRRGILKILHNERGVSVTERQRMKRELVKQATLSNPNLALPVVTGESGGQSWLFREWVEGVSLRVRLSRGGKLAVPEALAIAAQLAGALDELHRAGLLHRDLSPNHVILHPQPSGVPKVVVIDAGIAARIESNSGYDIAGTPGYVSPEQATGKLVSFRSDLYALGVLLFEMLEGRPPYQADGDAALIAAHASDPIPNMPSNIPSGVQQLIVQLLSKDPRERPFSAQQSKRVIEPFLPESKGQRDPTVSFLPQDADSAAKQSDQGSGTLRPPNKKMTIMGMPAAPNKPPPPPPEQAARASQPVASRPPPPPGERTSAAPRTSGPHGANGKKRESSVPPPPPADALKSKNAGKSADSTEELDALDLEPVEAPVIAAAPPTAPTPGGGVAPLPGGDLDYDDLAETTAMDRSEADAKLGAVGAAAQPAPAPANPQPATQTAPGFPAPSAPQSAPQAGAPASTPGAMAAFDQAAHAIESTNVPPTAEMPMQPAHMQQPAPMQPVLEPVKLPTKSKLPIILGVLGVGFCLVSAGVVGGGYYLYSSAQEELASFEGFEGIDLAAEPAPVPAPIPTPAPETAPALEDLHVEAAPEPEPEPEPEPVVEPEPEPVVEASERTERTEHASSMERTERAGSMERTERASSMERAERPAMGGGNDLDSLRAEAREHWTAGNFRGAAQAYERAAALAPRDAGVFMGLGSARYRMRDYRGAVQAYERAVELNPRNSGYMASLGRALLAAGDRAGARRAYERALSLDPNNAAARQALGSM